MHKLLDTENVLLTYDDVLLVPGYSDITSRHDIDLSSGDLGLAVPFISSNMDTITEEDMAIAMHNNGGMGIIHRFLDPYRLDQIIKRLRSCGVEPCISVGINGDSQELLHIAIKNKVKRYCVDVAHGHHAGVANRIGDIRSATSGWSDVKIIAGNVVTPEGAKFLIDAGANIIKVGVGPGRNCSTRTVTGHGLPQLSAISRISDSIGDGVEIIADGGIRSAGDIAKAISVGADYVMLGGLFSGCDETPGDTFMKNGKKLKHYRGMASYAAQKDRGRTNNTIIVEGVSTDVEATGPVSDVISKLRGGLASAFSYTGARNIHEFKTKARLIRITSSSYREGQPHGII